MSVRPRTWTTNGVEHKGWQADYTDAAGNRKRKQFKLKKDAEAFVARAKTEVADGTHIAPGDSISVGEGGDLWIKAKQRAGREVATVDQYKQHVDLHIKPFIGGMKLSDLTPARLSKFEDDLIDAGRSQAMVRKVLVSLGKVFAFGVEYGHTPTNPTTDISNVARPADLPDANRPWTPDEAVAILAAPIHLAAPIAMAAYLGLREGDIIKMSKGALAERLLSLTTSKTRRPLELPVCDDLWAILKRYSAWREALWDERRRKAAAKNSREDIQDLVMTMFVNSRGKAWTADGFRTSWGKWRDELAEAKRIAPGITFHGARHGVATVLAECGYEPQQVKHLLGHGSETMTEHYQRRAKRRGMLKDMTDAVQMAYRQVGKSTVVGLDTFPVRSAENGQG